MGPGGFVVRRALHCLRGADAGEQAKGEIVMNDSLNEFMQKVANESERRSQTLDKLLSSADSSKVFGEPVTMGSYTVITASEVASGGGFGSGMGLGTPRGRRGEARAEQAGAPEDAVEGAGGGGGGGGGSMGRPVAAIVVGPEGVEVRPLLDVTKISLAALTAFGAMAVLALKMLKRS
jgi:uncharacterized spore protein YtfJ